MSLIDLLAEGEGRSSLEDLESEVAALKEKVADLELAAVEAEREKQEALRLLGVSYLSDLAEAIRDLRKALEVKDDYKPELECRAAELVSAAEQLKIVSEENRIGTEQISGLETALDLAVNDRAALLAKLKMNDYEWSSQGGACAAHMEIR